MGPAGQGLSGLGSAGECGGIGRQPPLGSSLAASPVGPQRKGARWPVLPCSCEYCPASCPTSPLASCALGPLLVEPAPGDALPNPSPGLRPASSEREALRDGGKDAGWLCVRGEGPLLSGFGGGRRASLSWARGELPPPPAAPQGLRVWKVGSHAVRSSRTPSCRPAAWAPLSNTAAASWQS